MCVSCLDRVMMFQVHIPRDCLAFQMGEALEIASDGFLIATPHCVRGVRDAGIARNTFAVFIQPPMKTLLKPGYTFDAFTQDVLKRHYTVS